MCLYVCGHRCHSSRRGGVDNLFGILTVIKDTCCPERCRKTHTCMQIRRNVWQPDFRCYFFFLIIWAYRFRNICMETKGILYFAHIPAEIIPGDELLFDKKQPQYGRRRKSPQQQLSHTHTHEPVLYTYFHPHKYRRAHRRSLRHVVACIIITSSGQLNN